MKHNRVFIFLSGLVAVITAAISITMLESQTAALEVKRMELAGSPVTIWRKEKDQPAPLAVVAHGYAGSRQMMHAISLTLAHAGFVVAAFDFHGHGRHDQPMSKDISSLEGTTAQLVDQTVALVHEVQALPLVSGSTVLVGHSMATDIVVRTAKRLDDVSHVVAISMYSDAIETSFPKQLLIISGARESRLREVALDRLRQVDPLAEEGETAEAENVRRRATAAPIVGHVGVLYSDTTLSEIRNWLAEPNAPFDSAFTPRTGFWLAVLLVSTIALAWSLSTLLGRPRQSTVLSRRVGLAAACAPVLPALVATWFMPVGLLGLSAFGNITIFLGVWGGVQLAVLSRRGERMSWPKVKGLVFLLFWGLCLFAPLLDRYGASFVPTGPRLQVMALLVVGAIPFCLSDTILTRSADRLVWWLARVLPLGSLLVAMILIPRLGVAFTILPVLVLFWCVYGLAGRWVAVRTNAETSGIALGFLLAWSIAASTPLVAY